MNNFPPSPTRQRRGSAHSISMIGGTAWIISTARFTVVFLVSFLISSRISYTVSSFRNCSLAILTAPRLSLIGPQCMKYENFYEKSFFYTWPISKATAIKEIMTFIRRSSFIGKETAIYKKIPPIIIWVH